MNQISLSSLANFNSAVPWGLWVSIYGWLVGISCASYTIVMWANITNNTDVKKLTRLGVMLAISALMAGLLSILVDLGHMERFYKLFVSPNFSSMMAWEVWLYNIYFVLLGAVTLFWLKKEVPRPVSQFSVIFAVSIIIVESLLFAVPPGRAWHSPLFVAHFLTSSLAAGAGALILATAVLWDKNGSEGQLKALAKIAIPLVAVNFIAETAEMISHGALVSAGAALALFAAVLAVVLLRSAKPSSIKLAGLIALVSTLAAKYVSLISAQAVMPYKGFEKAYIEPKLAFSYCPSLPETLMGAGLVVSAAVILYILYKLFPLTREG
ncbi:MAG: NrfD/PsrC family molybdoenzyme membrane anchor subunit [Candidatus Omnitrophota bacterium]|nr:NrfD/PsrC family molybdoenzyme membrane anchor subunit [Candidatus Omnitrophota bacterium]